jgi:type VI protein secretion system component VasF
VTPSATVYYTTNGTTPTTNSTKYTGPIKVAMTQTLEAIAVETGYSSSTVATAKYTLVAATPTFSPARGTFNAPQTVAISSVTPGATVYYTTNGTTPTTNSTKYTGAIKVATTQTFEAIAVATGYSNSTVNTAKYAIR